MQQIKQVVPENAAKKTPALPKCSESGKESEGGRNLTQSVKKNDLRLSAGWLATTRDPSFFGVPVNQRPTLRQRAAAKERSGFMAKDVARTREYQALKASLLKNLKSRGLDSALYEDKVQEYMDFWKLHKELQRDIQERGMVVYDDRKRLCENRSISLDVQVSRQMLNLFAAMGFKPQDLKPGNGADDDDL